MARQNKLTVPWENVCHLNRVMFKYIVMIQNNNIPDKKLLKCFIYYIGIVLMAWSHEQYLIFIFKKCPWSSWYFLHNDNILAQENMSQTINE